MVARRARRASGAALTGRRIARFDALDGPDALTACAAQLGAHGFAILENAVSVEHCDEIVAEISRLEAGERMALKANAFTGYNTVRYFDLLNGAEVWQRVAANPHLLPVLRAALGADMLLSTMATAVIGPGEPAQPLHRDDALYELPMPHRNLVCNTMWALVDFTDANGATRIAPDTHRLLENSDPAGLYDTVPAEMPKGAVCFVLGTTYHGGGANRTAERRWALTINYCTAAVRPQEALALSTPIDRVACFAPELQDLLGYRTSRRGLGHVDAGDPRQVFARARD